MTEGENYKVGYGKPPPDHQFKKGRSGNPRGRPRSNRSLGAILAKVFDEKVTIAINGKQRRVPLVEAALRKTLMTAVSKGSIRDLERIVQLNRSCGLEQEASDYAKQEKTAQEVLEKIMTSFDRHFGVTRECSD